MIENILNLESTDYSGIVRISMINHIKTLPGPILLTGHTGFKGTWMTFLMESLGIQTIGYSLAPEKGSLFDRADRSGKIPELFADIRNYEDLEGFIKLHKPSAIIHMAAQALVLESYVNPRNTFEINVSGTVNVLDIAFKTESVKAVVVITTDKVYKNQDNYRAFVESDSLEGKDPYSASKVAAEAVVAAWQQIESVSKGPKVISVRAGNVIGGGDFAKNRLIPDLIRGEISRELVLIRNPESTRPWQHVLDPLEGYILSLDKILGGGKVTSLNFGPRGPSLSVKDVIELGKKIFDFNPQRVVYETSRHTSDLEANHLALDSNQATLELNWHPKWTQEEAVMRTFEFWNTVLNEKTSFSDAIKIDIAEFQREI